jgi:hypothetical protein
MVEQLMNIHKKANVSTVWKRWELYSEDQKEAILEEFRHKFPDTYLNKELLVKFLLKKHHQGRH